MHMILDMENILGGMESCAVQSIFKKFSCGFYGFRGLGLEDMGQRYLGLLGQLTCTPEVGVEEMRRLYREKFFGGNGVYWVVVVEHRATGELVGNGTLYVEPCFGDGLKAHGHVEDIVVDKSHRKKGLGVKIMNFLSDLAKFLGCEKT